MVRKTQQMNKIQNDCTRNQHNQQQTKNTLEEDDKKKRNIENG